MSKPSYERQYTYAQVVCAGQPQCKLEHLELPTPDEYPPISGVAWTAGRLMSDLQYSRNAPVTWESMKIAVEALHRTLPVSVKNQVLVLVGDHARIFDSSTTNNAQWTIDTKRSLPGGVAAAAAAFSKHEYILWPFEDGNGHWVTTIIHLTEAKPADDTRTHVSQIALIDPLKDTTSSLRAIRLRARVILVLRLLGFTIEDVSNRWRNVWVPEQPSASDNSSGPRAYWVCKETTRRLLEMYEYATGYHESLWNDHSGWFHPEMVRHEIISAHAWLTIAGMNHRGRLAVEGINRVRKTATSAWEHAGRTMAPPPESDPPREPTNPDVPTRIPLDSTSPAAYTPLRPVFALPPRRQPLICPNFSMNNNDNLFNYDGWAEAPGNRAVVWDDPDYLPPAPGSPSQKGHRRPGLGGTLF